MPVISVVRDAEARTLTVTAHFAAPIDRVWQIWSDPRQLERWWGPPRYPAKVLEHDLAPGGTVAYVMTGPDGQQYGGRWYVRTVEEPHALEFETGFADPEGNRLPDAVPGIIRVTLSEPAEGTTQMVITSTWDSDEAMERTLATGMEAGLTAGVGQVDALLASVDGRGAGGARLGPVDGVAVEGQGERVLGDRG